MTFRSVKSAAFGVDVSWDRQHTSMVAAVAQGEVTVVIVAAYLERVPVAEIVAFLKAQEEKKAIVLDPLSMAAFLIEPLKKAHLRLSEPGSHDVAVAHGLFADGIGNGSIKYVANPALEAAVKDALARPLAGAQALDRKKPDVDVSPFVAAELATWGLLRGQKPLPQIY